MRIEIDQSGKLEDTNKHTFLAYSNNSHFVLKLGSTEKKKLQKYFRSIGKPRLYIYITFASLIIILLEKFKSSNNQIIIDTEYPGKSHLIRDLIKNMRRNFPIKEIVFHSIGKKSRAHFLAKGTAIKKLNPDIVIRADRVLKIIKKSGSA